VGADILIRRADRFVAWLPPAQSQVPVLVIGRLQPGNPPTIQVARVPMPAVAGLSGLYEVPASLCGLTAGVAYHYWIEVDDSRSSAAPPARIAVTDPFATSVDWRVFPPGASDCTQPASVVAFDGAKLVDSDPNGETAVLQDAGTSKALAANNKLVIYELPTAWAFSRTVNSVERAVATFADVAALFDPLLAGANFQEVPLLAPPNAYLRDLGINALELLPVADSFFKREWGYDTSHYLAPDSELGFPEGNLSPTANRDLASLVQVCHRGGVRFIVDSVMAFGREDGYNHMDSGNFHIDNPKDPANAKDPDAFTSTRGDGTVGFRDGFGSTLWRYAKFVTTYDPVAGVVARVAPARQLMLVYLERWMRDFHVDGVRIDSVENVANWDFLGTFKDTARAFGTARTTADGVAAGDAPSKFLVVGEELSLPLALLTQNRLDGLWNEDFQTRVRAAILGENASMEPTFEWTVKKAIDCRLIGFSDLAQAILYVTKHDVEGFRHERLFTMLQHLPDDQIEKRIKLAFVCLTTAVGIPMILAGEEFGDQHDFFDANGNVTDAAGKEVDPVNFDRLSTSDTARLPMRQRILAYVKTLIGLRTTAPALAVNDTSFIHQDFDDGKRVVAWARGGAGMAPVVVVANFSDFASAPGTGYVVHGWPATPAGATWVEVTQGRVLPPSTAGTEPIFSWEAKVYTLRS
jgi:1,4-alpha-glucan branching enzyme